MEKSDCVYKTSREIKVSVPAQDLVNTLLDDIISERVSDIVSEEHDGNGIVIPGSVNVVSRTPLYQDLTRFDGAYACHVRYVADCYDAPKGMTTTAVVRVTLPNGILCETEQPEMRHPVFRVFLPYEVHDDATRDRMRSLIRDQVVRFRSIQRYGGLGDITIDVLGEFQEAVGEPPVSGKSASLRTKEPLRVEDFRTPKGPDSDDPAALRQHQGEMGEGGVDAEEDDAGEGDAGAGSAEPADGVVPPPPTDEPTLYNLWVQYNAALTKSQAREAKSFERQLITGIQALGKMEGMWYDPTHRRFTAYLRGIDVPVKSPHFLYRPLPNDNLGSIRGIQPVEHIAYDPVAEYDMVVSDPSITKHASTTRILQESLPRRLYGVLPEKVLVLSFLKNPNIAFENTTVATIDSMGDYPETRKHHTDIQVRVLDTGIPVGEQLVSVIQGIEEGDDVPDLIVLDARNASEMMGGEVESKTPEDEKEPDIVLDTFIPTYPLVVDTSVLVFTPTQAIQCEGSYNRAKSPMDTLQSFLGCAAAELGAHIQRPPGSAGTVTFRPAKPPTMRVARVIPDTTRAIPTNEHGWMSLDTHAALVGTMRTMRPSTVFELGSWYGLSTRTMLDEAKGTTIYAFDKFKAPPLISYEKKRVGVEDNFFFHHPRHDTFAANVSTSLRGLGALEGTAAAAASGSSGRNNVYMVKGDASRVTKFATSKRISPEVIFIDFEKNTARLKKLITDLRSAFPKVIIVGDDLIFDSVKRVVRSLPKANTIVYSESYIVLPDDFPTELRKSLEESIASAREELKDSEQIAAVREHIKEGRIGDVMRAYPAGESVTSTISHTQAQTALHESIRVAKNTKPRAITSEVIQQLIDDSPNWKNGSVNFAALTPWDYLVHKLSFFKGEDN